MLLQRAGLVSAMLATCLHRLVIPHNPSSFVLEPQRSTPVGNTIVGPALPKDLMRISQKSGLKPLLRAELISIVG